MGDLDKNPAVKAMVVFRKAMRTIDAQVAPSYKKQRFNTNPVCRFGCSLC